MAQPQLYLLFNGNCRQAFDHYSRVLNGKIEFMQTFGEAQGSAGAGAGSESAGAASDQIMHISMDVNGTKIMGSDAPGEHAVTIGSNFSISVDADTEEGVDKLYNALAEGGQVTMPLSETFWSKRFGMCTDKFGVNWMVSYAEVKLPA
jgi:PhnB protein